MSSTLGEKIKLTLFGESHGPSIGVVIDGLPAGLELDWQEVNREMQRRAPGKSKLTTARREADRPIIESGFFNGKTTGMPLCARIVNSNTQSKDYSQLQTVMRPGHGDYAGYIKYKGCNDYRGGGSFSGRLTAPLVFAGAIAKQLLRQKKIEVGAHIASLAGIFDTPFHPQGERSEILQALGAQVLPLLDEEKRSAMENAIVKAQKEKDSVGGVIECIAINMPTGLGEPFFDSVESRLSHALFSIPAVKAVGFGEGFGFAGLRGSQANDAMEYKEGRVHCLTNHNGGVTGGISNGMPLVFSVAIKPTPSISRPQQTVDVVKKENAILTITGRHDPCIVPRAVPVVEAVTAWTLLDLYHMAMRG